MLALAFGLLCVIALGAFHHASLRVIGGMAGRGTRSPDVTVLFAVTGLAVVHTVEIVGFAAVYALVLSFEGTGTFQGWDRSFTSLVYYAGIYFTTLGYTQAEAEGPIRLIGMMSALGGFMVLTWSATFLYTTWQDAFRS